MAPTKAKPQPADEEAKVQVVTPICETCEKCPAQFRVKVTTITGGEVDEQIYCIGCLQYVRITQYGVLWEE